MWLHTVVIMACSMTRPVAIYNVILVCSETRNLATDS
jgi:hypothetical protein